MEPCFGRFRSTYLYLYLYLWIPNLSISFVALTKWIRLLNFSSLLSSSIKDTLMISFQRQHQFSTIIIFSKFEENFNTKIFDLVPVTLPLWPLGLRTDSMENINLYLMRAENKSSITWYYKMYLYNFICLT